MLRNRSRTVTKQSLMADHNSVPSPKPKHTTIVSSFFGYPKFFNGFFSKGITKFETVISPAKHSSRIPVFQSLLGYYDQNMAKSPRSLTKKNQFRDAQGIGLALIDSKNDEKSLENLNFTKQSSCRRVHFASTLKVQIPTLQQSTNSSMHSQKSLDHGVSQFSEIQENEFPSISWSEMELSEDYTCVITHGPNPKTTRIFNNCIIESRHGVVELSDLEKEYKLSSPFENFLSFCYTCEKNLGQGKDIYVYRGDMAFCSNECRCQEMLLDGFTNSEI